MTSPSYYALPHPLWRIGQLEAIQWAESLPAGSMGILNAMTGLGKSCIPAALAHSHRAIVLTETKVLQDQYEYYGATVLKGRGNYPCVHPQRLFPDATAAECVFGEGMSRCPHYGECPYGVQKVIAQDSQFVALNYHYFSLVGKTRRQGELMWDKDYLVLDEAHALADIVLRYYSVDVTPKHKSEYALPDFPSIPAGVPTVVAANLSIPYLTRVTAIVNSHASIIRGQFKSARGEEAKKRLSWRLSRAQNMAMRLMAVRKALETKPDDWYVKSGGSGFFAKPLTARHVFPDMFRFDNATVIAMSATIGKFDEFAEELGVAGYESREVPSKFGPETRPIYVYKNCPRMSARATEADFEKQAGLIAAAIEQCPPEWSGLIHVTRKSEAVLLANRLRKYKWIGDRVWVTPGHDGNYVATDEQVMKWKQRLAKVPNSLACSWSMGTGYNGEQERICVIAKIKFPVFGGPGSYEAAWRTYSSERYFYEAANMTVQALGRTRRGRDEDYDELERGVVRGFVGVFDGSFNGRVRDKMSEGIRESLVEV